MGKAPLDLGWGFEGVVTVVAAHPQHDVVAAGYEDGATILVQIDRDHPVLGQATRQGRCDRARLVGGWTASRTRYRERLCRSN